MKFTMCKADKSTLTITSMKENKKDQFKETSIQSILLLSPAGESRKCHEKDRCNMTLPDLE